MSLNVCAAYLYLRRKGPAHIYVRTYIRSRGRQGHPRPGRALPSGLQIGVFSGTLVVCHTLRLPASHQVPGSMRMEAMCVFRVPAANSGALGAGRRLRGRHCVCVCVCVCVHSEAGNRAPVLNNMARTACPGQRRKIQTSMCRVMYGLIYRSIRTHCRTLPTFRAGTHKAGKSKISRFADAWPQLSAPCPLTLPGTCQVHHAVNAGHSEGPEQGGWVSPPQLHRCGHDCQWGCVSQKECERRGAWTFGGGQSWKSRERRAMR